MKNLKDFNARIMEEKLKIGWGTSDFATYFQCSEEEFIQKVEKTLSAHAARGMLARLKKNDKRKSSVTHKTSSKSSSEAESIPCSSSETKIYETEEDEIKEVQTSENNVSSVDLLISLKAQYKAIQSVLNELELQHKTLSSDRHQIRKLIQAYKDELIKLKEKIQTIQMEVSNLVTELEQKYGEMQVLNNEISKKRAQLEEIDAKIESLSKISILVYSSGDFEVDTPFQVETPEWKEHFDMIISYEEAGSLTINQLKGISKLLALLKFIDLQEWKYEIVFEDENVEELFNIIKYGVVKCA